MLMMLLERPGGLALLAVFTLGIIAVVLAVAWSKWEDDERDDR